MIVSYNLIYINHFNDHYNYMNHIMFYYSDIIYDCLCIFIKNYRYTKYEFQSNAYSDRFKETVLAR